MNDPLFALPSDAYTVTSDDCYTPRWVFDAMGLRFDLDVAAPPGGPWYVPAERWYTAEDDGLTSPWNGVVWCNPPWSQFGVWADRYERHDRAAIMGLCLSETLWFPQVAFRGVGTGPAERLAAADPYGVVLYGRPTP